MQELEDDKEIDFDTADEEQINGVMSRRLDRKLSEIFLKTEVFY